MSLAFLYNVASCIAYALVSAAYGSLYYVERRRGYLFVALIFLAYTIDIVLLFMYEFVPEFAMQFEGARNAYPMFHTAYSIGCNPPVSACARQLALAQVFSYRGILLGGLHDGGLGKRRFIG